MYFKRANSPQLLARNISHTDDLRTTVTLSDFLSRAWRIANDKARELRKGGTLYMEPVEFTRAHYRPDRITTLFVGESAPDA
jgi:hypothetical protein